MGARITGDFGTLAKMRAKLAKLPEAPQKAAQHAAPQFEAALRNEFSTESGPTGKAWKADKPKTYALGTKSILQRSGALYGTISSVAQGARIVISLGTSYLKFQMGKGRNPMPAKAGRLPKPWNAILTAEVKATWEAVMGK